MSAPQTPLRILHAANFSEKKRGATYYAMDRKISNGLIRNGHLVQDFSYRDIARVHAPLQIKRLGIAKMNKLFLETAENLQPDLLLLGHTELLSNETLQAFRRRFPKAKIAMWWVDSLAGLMVNKPLFEARIALLDGFFLTSDPSSLGEVINLGASAAQAHFMPNMCDPSIETGRAFERDAFRHDVVFVGRATSLRQDLMTFLDSQLLGINLGVYGQNKDSLVLGADYIDLLSSCRLAINYSRPNNISLYSSDRMVHLAANGCLVLTPRTPNMETVFSEDEVAYFDSLAELEEKIRLFLSDDALRKKVAAAGHHRAMTSYNCQVVTQDMLDTLYASARKG